MARKVIAILFVGLLIAFNNASEKKNSGQTDELLGIMTEIDKVLNKVEKTKITKDNAKTLWEEAYAVDEPFWAYQVKNAQNDTRISEEVKEKIVQKNHELSAERRKNPIEPNSENLWKDQLNLQILKLKIIKEHVIMDGSRKKLKVAFPIGLLVVVSVVLIWYFATKRVTNNESDNDEEEKESQHAIKNNDAVINVKDLKNPNEVEEENQQPNAA